jgi:hypothetical protein
MKNPDFIGASNPNQTSQDMLNSITPDKMSEFLLYNKLKTLINDPSTDITTNDPESGNEPQSNPYSIRSPNIKTTPQIFSVGDESKYDTNYRIGSPGGKNEVRAAAQPWYSELANTIVEPILNFPFMTGQYIAAGLMPDDFKEIDDLASKHAYDWFKNYADQVRENFPVYQTNRGGFQGAREYLLSTLQQVGESAGPFLAIGALAAKATAMTMGGAGAVVGPMAGKIIQMMAQTKSGMDRINLLRNAVTTANVVQSGGQVASTLATAYALNKTESMIEAADTYAELLESNKDRILNEIRSKKGTEGYEFTQEELDGAEKEAKSIAAVGASATEQFNRVNMLLNITSAARFMKPLMKSRKAFVPITGKNMRHAIGMETLQEAGEETINLLAQKYGKSVAEGDKRSISEFLMSTDALRNVLSEEGMHSAFAGALGGAVQTGGTEFLSNKTKRYKQALGDWNKVVSDLDEFKKSKGTPTLSTAFADVITKSELMNDYNIAMEQAEKTGNYDKVRAIQSQFHTLQALHAFDSGAGGQLQETYEAIRDMPVEEAEKLGYDVNPDSDQFYKAKAEKALEHIAELELEYNFANSFSNKNDVYYNRATGMFIQEQLTEGKELLNTTRGIAQERANEIFGDIPFDFNDLANAEAIKDPDYQKALTEYLNSIEHKLLTRDMNNVSNWERDLRVNKARFDKLISPEEQKKSTEKKQKEESAIIEAKRKAEEEAKRQANLEKVEQAKRQKINQNLRSLGYTEADMDKLSDSQKDSILSSKLPRHMNPLIIAEEQVRKKKEEERKADEEKRKQEEEQKRKDEEAEKERKRLEEEEKIKDQVDKNGQPLATKSEIEAVANKLYNEGEGNLNERERYVNQEYADDVEAEKESIRLKKEHNNFPKKKELPPEERIKREVPRSEISEVFEVLDKGKEQENKSVLGKLIEYGHDAIAYLSRNFQIQRDGNEQFMVVSKEDMDNELNEGLMKDLLDPKKFRAGTKIVMRPEPAYEGRITNPAPIDGSDAVRENQVLWSEFSKDMDPNSDSYIATVPIAIYDSSGNKLGYVHDLAWIQNKENNLAYSDPSDSKNLMNLRYTVLQKGEAGFETIVKSKSKGTLAVAKNGAKASVSERLPSSKLGVFTTAGLEGKTGLTVDSNLLNENMLVLGRTYAVITMADGSNVALPIDTDRLGEGQYAIPSMIVNSVANFISGNTADIKAMQNMGYDINSFSGIREFASNFVYSFNFENEAETFQDFIDGMEKSGEGSAKTYFNFTNNAVEFGRPNSFVYKIFIDPKDPTKVRVQKGKGKIYTYDRKTAHINPDGVYMDALNALKNELANKGMNVSAKRLGQKFVMPGFNQQGAIVPAFQGTYDDFVKQHTKTQFLSFNIGTEESPNYVSAIQPVIRFDTSGMQTKPETPFVVVQDDTIDSKVDIGNKIKIIEDFTSKDFFTPSDVLKNHWKTKKDLFENKIGQLKSLIESGINNGQDLRRLTDLLNTIRGVLNEGININFTEAILENEKNIRDLAQSLKSLISGEVVQDYINVMNKAMLSRIGPNAVQQMAVEYSDGTELTIDGKNAEYFITKTDIEKSKDQGSKVPTVKNPSKFNKRGGKRSGLDQSTGRIETRNDEDSLPLIEDESLKKNEVQKLVENRFTQIEQQSYQKLTGQTMEQFLNDNPTTPREVLIGNILKSLCG